MELNQNKQYLVFNYCSSPITVATRHDSHIIPGGTHEEPSTFPFTLEELAFINNNSGVFKYGLLWFEEEYAPALYDYLRIRDYDKIMTDEQITDMLLHPTPDGLQAILDITNDVYFNRVRGIYTHLKNTRDISGRVGRLIAARYKEILNKKLTSSITIERTQVNSESPSSNKQVAALEERINNLEGLLNKIASAVGADNTPAEQKSAEENIEPEDKPVVKKDKATKAKKVAEDKDNN